MDYEKEYKKLKAGISKAYLYAQTDSTKAVLENILPELTENEDERTRRSLIDAIKIGYSNNGISFTKEAADRYIAWLEKQKEQKPEEDNEYRKAYWKPSEEQMEALAYAIQVLNSNPHPKSAKAYQDLQTLYKNIKYGN